MVKPFDTWDGVYQVVSGYTGGHMDNPSYEAVKSGESGHYEAVQISYDPKKIDYQTILDLYWPQIDPTDAGGQFHDRGPQYRTAVFYHDDEQKKQAEEAKAKLINSQLFKSPIVTDILPASRFYPAEDYHQNYYQTHAEDYQKDREKSGRDVFIQTHWKK
ncbi:peptide methionine sulfoxide reductase MsrA [Halolactibacillus alkaliphilus]|uniref:Peptide methionine sulfoxide reductase MsrA n=2 Tax=Halolactibacillus alkaliphilus TaxID=442899 RepID=A0A511WZX7_9BACI|nr:peptide methionine sulfoxide reductase MsrA [Halolactibacillus alkaliphilus]GGN66413.1 peptide methionine sulfoxide reductase MsrA [Halolactibacillus alkaliphilus]